MEALGAAAAASDQVGIGVVIPYDFALDRELWRWVPAQVSLHLTRTWINLIEGGPGGPV